MNIAQLIALIALSVALFGCANLQPVVAKSSKQEAISGYVTGYFSRVGHDGFAFILTNVTTKTEYAMPLGEKDKVAAIKVPPGLYKVSHWMTYEILSNDKLSKRPVSNSELSNLFTVEPGSVIYLGNFSLTSTWVPELYKSTSHWEIKPTSVTLKEAQTAFQSAYPAFSGYTFECILCVETLAKRRVSAMTLPQ